MAELLPSSLTRSMSWVFERAIYFLRLLILTSS